MLRSLRELHAAAVATTTTTATTTNHHHFSTTIDNHYANGASCTYGRYEMNEPRASEQTTTTIRVRRAHARASPE